MANTKHDIRGGGGLLDATEMARNTPTPFGIAEGEVVAIEPSAIGKAFFPGFFNEEAAFERKGPLGVVTVDGPLMQKAGWFWDGYNAIQDRFTKAMADTNVRAVVLKLDSPGGMCAGLFEAVDAMMRVKAQSKKPVYAYAGEMACSAAYALASVADEIYLPKSGLVGSVGVIITLAEQSEALSKEGIRVAVIATGKQKTDGHPAIPLTDEVIARFRGRADYLNAMFVSQVATSRGMTASKVLGLEAGVFYGEDAVNAKLADGVSSYDAFLATVESKTKVSPQRAAAAARAAEGTKMEDEKNTAPVAGSAAFAIIAATLGMRATSPEGDVQARVRVLADCERDLLRATGKATLNEALGTVKAWQVSHDQLAVTTTELVALRKRDSDREIDALIEGAKSAGKITNPVLEKACRDIGATSPEQLRALIGTLAVVGGGTLKKDSTVEPEVGVVLTDTDRELAKSFGISLEDMAKTRRDDLARKAG